MTNSDRTRELDTELRALAALTRTARRDRMLARAGALLLLAGVVIAIVGYAISATTTDPLRQRDALVLGQVATTVSVLGLALFLRYSVGRFLRFWLARLIHEHQSTKN